MIYLGIDTSNYTTSVAIIKDGEVFGLRRMLPVKKGERGIRQSDGAFHHMKNLPELYSEICSWLDGEKIAAVGVSAKPRRLANSYMPVFMSGYGFARVIADTLCVPMLEFSHQEGHIMAGIHSEGCMELLDDKFLSVHLSGGTTEILTTEYKRGIFECHIIGGTKDISAGQFIDRVGVKMGLNFPAGKYVEILSHAATEPVELPIKTEGTYVNFSGVETKATRMIDKYDKAQIALGVLKCVADALVKIINSAVEQTTLKRVLVVGGVASNLYIRERLQSEVNAAVYFAKPEFSTDNAAGIAIMTQRIMEKANGTENWDSITDKCICQKDFR